jgi:hypothetical protein
LNEELRLFVYLKLWCSNHSRFVFLITRGCIFEAIRYLAIIIPIEGVSMTRLAAIWLLPVSCLLLVPHGSRAQALSKVDALNELSNEFAQCYAFYRIELSCSEAQLTPDVKAGLTNAIDTTIRSIYLYGRAAGVSDAASLANVKLAFKSLMADTNTNCLNISVILVKYADSCKALVEHPETRFNQLITNGP